MSPNEEHPELIAILEALNEIRDLMKEGVDLKRRQLGIAIEADAEDDAAHSSVGIPLTDGKMWCKACDDWRGPTHFKYYGIHQPRRETE